MTDKELLELAAKAAGIETIAWGLQFDETGWFCNPTGEHWNPLTDDGDALRLAVKLGLSPEWGGFDVEICRQSSGARNFCYVEQHDNDPYSATRRAIVRAAAEIGRQM